MIKILRNNFFLGIIVFLALFLRVYHLGAMPLGLHEDEVMNGYVGHYILANGVDLYGNHWPLLYFDNFGDYPNVIPMYLSGISTFIFGVNAFAIRFPIALFGAFTTLPIYLISRQIFVKKKYALLSALFIAILPWHIILSRSTAENVTATFIYLFAIFFLFKFLRRGGLFALIPAFVLGASTYLLYPSYRIVVPLTFFVTALFSLKNKKKVGLLFILGLVFLSATFFISRTVWGQGRFHQTSIFYFNDMVSHRLQDYSFGIGSGKTLEARIFYNKPVGFLREFIRQYVSYLSPNFLFTDASKPDRYRLSETGIVPITFLLIGLLGILINVFTDKKSLKSIFTSNGKTYFFLLLIFLGLSLIPAALTLDDTPNIHRALPIGVLATFFTTFCYIQIDSYATKFKKYILSALFLILTLETIYFWHQWSAYGPIDQAPFRDQGRVLLAKYLNDRHSQYDSVFLSKNAKVLFYLLEKQDFDPKLAGKFSYNIYLENVDNLHFVNSNCVSSEKGLPITAHSLVVEDPNCQSTPNYSLKQIDTIKREDTIPAFNILITSPTILSK